MIKQGMQKGEVFRDGNLFYKIDKVIDDFYESHIISKEEYDISIKSESADLEDKSAEELEEKSAGPEASAEEKPTEPIKRTKKK